MKTTMLVLGLLTVGCGGPAFSAGGPESDARADGGTEGGGSVEDAQAGREGAANEAGDDGGDDGGMTCPSPWVLGCQSLPDGTWRLWCCSAADFHSTTAWNTTTCMSPWGIGTSHACQ